MADLPASILHLHVSDIEGEEQGQFRHRVLNAIALLEGDAAFAPAHRSWRSPDAVSCALAADLLVVHGLAGTETEALIRHRRGDGKVTLYEIADELTAPRSWSRLNPGKPNALTVGRQLFHASLCDGVQFSSAWLADRYAELNERRAVLGNIVAFPVEMPAKPAGFVFGWAGTRSHKEDLRAILPEIEEFCRRHADAVFALMGDEELQGVFTGLAPGQRRFRPFGSYEDYRQFLRSLHVCLVPLLDGGFNRGRSDVKVVEAAAEGAAVIAQEAIAFAACGDAVLSFRTGPEMLAHLESLYQDRRALEDAAQAGCAILSERKGEAAVRAAHRAWYSGWKVAAGGPLREPPPEARALAGRLDDAMRAARTGETESALAAAQALIERDPSYVQARWLAAQLLADDGRTGDALDCGAPLAACPVFGPSWKTVGERLTMGPASEGAEGPAHPFQPFALAAELKRSREEGDIETADRLRRRLSLFLGDAAAN
ncbi:MAG: hypothetical protein JWO81_589 [Alphaproteobacteria bacterium]|nr:hypothetical protein [Alphaproteobacteria bacterium]